MKYFIYCLEFEDGTRYIGATKNIMRRMGRHRFVFKRSFTYFVLDETDEQHALLLECMWAQLYKSWGFALINKQSFENVDLSKTPNHGGGRKPVTDKKIPITVFFPKRIVDALGKETMKKIGEQAIERLTKRKRKTERGIN